MGGTELLILAAVTAITAATSAAAKASQNAALQEQLNAQGEQAQAEINELARQRREANEQAQEKKSDRARQGDKEIASLLASLAEVGGGGTQIAGRLVGETAGDTSLDLARLEGNRDSQVRSLFAQQKALASDVRVAGISAKGKARANTIQFFGETAGSVVGAVGSGLKIQRAQQTKA